MRILLTGASGFIGTHLASALGAAGHSVLCAARQPPTPVIKGCAEFVRVDFSVDHTPEAWVPRLDHVDVVINAVGILRERGNQTFASLHVNAPRALFDACLIAGVRRVINLSALGADANARSGYHLSKQRADEHLSRLPLCWNIVQPSLVYGAEGGSAHLFDMLASLPVIPLPGGGRQRIQPIHIDDLVAGIVALVNEPSRCNQVIPFVGPVEISLRDYLQRLRDSMELGRARALPIPAPLVRMTAKAGKYLPGGFLDEEAIAMLERGSVADAAPLTALIARRPRAPADFIGPHEAQAARESAQLAWILPAFRVTLALMWLWTAIVSLGLYPTASSYDLLARTGIPAALRPLFLYGAAALDFALGIATLALRRRRILWLVQLSLILFYTVVITVCLPEFWLHPYGPVLKNLPLLAMITALHVMERR